MTIGGNLCLDTLVPGEERIRHISDDQSIVTGYAIDLTEVGFIPLEQWLAREMARRLFELVRAPIALCTDGKVLVVLEESGLQRRLRAVSCSLLAQVGDIELQRAVVQVVREAIQDLAARLPGFEPAMPGDTVVNGSGTFAMGGPEGDNGLSGKKLLLDHYGPGVPIGGTALSGKDFWKPDRAPTAADAPAGIGGAPLRRGEQSHGAVHCLPWRRGSMLHAHHDTRGRTAGRTALARPRGLPL